MHLPRPWWAPLRAPRAAAAAAARLFWEAWAANRGMGRYRMAQRMARPIGEAPRSTAPEEPGSGSMAGAAPRCRPRGCISYRGLFLGSKPGKGDASRAQQRSDTSSLLFEKAQKQLLPFCKRFTLKNAWKLLIFHRGE